jgi:hypothetical protein
MRIWVEGYITEMPGSDNGPSGYLALHGAEKMRARDGREFFRCFSPVESNLYVGPVRRVRGASGRLDAHKVIVSGIYRNEVIERNDGTLTFIYKGSFEEPRIEKAYADICTGIPEGAVSGG